MSSPLSVIMTVYNGEPYLGEAVTSLLQQTYSDFELVVVNNGSTDNSLQILRSFTDPRLRLIELERTIDRTPVLNVALEATRGDYVAVQDADDISLPQRLEKQMAHMAQHPDLAVLGTQGYIIDQKGHLVSLFDIPALDRTSIRWRQCCFGGSFIHSSVMFRRRVVWDEFRGYDEAFTYCQDFDLWSKVLVNYSGANLPERLIKWRTHSASLSVTMQEKIMNEGKPILYRNLQAIFNHHFSEAELDLASEFNPAFQTKRVYSPTFVNLFQRLLVTYQKLFPEAVTSPSFHATVAEQYTWLGYRLLATHPALAYQVLLKGVKYSPTGLLSSLRRRFIKLWGGFRIVP